MQVACAYSRARDSRVRANEMLREYQRHKYKYKYPRHTVRYKPTTRTQQIETKINSLRNVTTQKKINIVRTQKCSLKTSAAV